MTHPDIIRSAARAYAEATRNEAAVRMDRERMEAEIAASLIGSDNPATGKAHSASSSKEAAKDTPEVQALRALVVEAEVATIIARGEYEAARVGAWLAVGVPA